MKIIILCIIIFTIQIKVFSQWEASNKGLGNGTVGALYADSDTLYACTTFGVYKSTDLGDNWFKIGNGLPAVTNFYSFVRSGNFLITGGDSQGIWQSSDNGSNWIQIKTGADSDEYIQSFYTDSNNIYAAIGYTSAIWIKSTNAINSLQTVTGVTRLGSLLFATHLTLGLYLSTDNGTIWTLQPGLIGAQDKNAIITIGNKMCVATNTGIFYSADTGKIWTQTLSSGVITGFGKNSTELYAVGELLYKSYDDGLTWTQVDDNGLPGTIWNTIQFAGNYAFVNYYGSGVYRRLVSEITSINNDQKNITGREFRLFQNYPNPFNPSTTIKYAIPKAEYVRLKVYDILGNEVANLVDVNQQAGYYEINFDGTHLPIGKAGLSSGLYIYSITAGSNNSIRKMLMLK
jgi:photosystem II stability/assembly factor-like uncharacterized protein